MEKQGFTASGTHMTGSIWDQVLSRIETKVNRHIFYTWFKPTSFVADTEGSLRVRVPNALFRDWLTKHYAGVLDEALSEVDRKGTVVTFVTEATDTAEPEPAVTRAPAAVAPPPAAVVEAPPESAPDVQDDYPAGGLAPRYSFDTFIVGPSNQFAHAACRAVAEAPSRSYNPARTSAWSSTIRTEIGLSGLTSLMPADGNRGGCRAHHPRVGAASRPAGR